MAKPEGINSEVQLLVEGKDQENFFKALIGHLSLENIQIQDFGGTKELRNFLLGFVKQPDFRTVQSIGIVRDAEKSPAGAFQSVQSSLAKVELPVPQNVGVRTNGSPAVTVLIFPDENRPGMLETLICETFANTPLDHCISDFLTCVEDLPEVSVRNPDKARAHAFLATKPEPHCSIGVAALKKYLDLNHNVFCGVRDFLRKIL